MAFIWIKWSGSIQQFLFLFCALVLEGGGWACFRKGEKVVYVRI